MGTPAQVDRYRIHTPPSGGKGCPDMKRSALVVVAGLTVLGAVTIGSVGTAAVASAAKPKVPTIREILPQHGPEAGGTTVEILGKNLGGVTGVSFGTTAALMVTPVSQSAVLATSPAGTGSVDVTVTTGIGTSVPVSADQFSYVITPTIANVTPHVGTTLGGNRVTITGAGFTGATAVSFGTLAATSYTVETDQEILATSPAGSAGNIDVSVTSPSGTTSIDPADVFTYSLKVGIISSVVPDVGPSTGGTTVTISGKNFKNVSAVTFGTMPAAGFTVTSPRSITAVSPSGTGTVDIIITNASGVGGGGSPVDQFTYTP